MQWPELPGPGEEGYKRRRKKLPVEVDIPDEINNISDFSEFEIAVFGYCEKEYGIEPMGFHRPWSAFDPPVSKKRRTRRKK